MADFPVRLTFSPALQFFLRPRSGEALLKILREKTSVKDVIETCGVPHTEVDLILVQGTPVDFGCQLREAGAVEVFGVDEAPAALGSFRLQPRNADRFVADGHLRKLARYLRLLGVDVVCEPTADDRKLLDIMADEERALLTRDRRLLMHARVDCAYYVRSQIADEQVVEIVRRFYLQEALAAFTRCVRCNAPLAAVSKAEVLPALEPLTRIYYEDFRRCTGCGQIYWSGTHYPRLHARVARLLEKF
jgi:uncharacterized protein with PIN domain